MGEYFIDLIILFSFYSFIGWILETVFKSIRDKQFINSGFLSGPFCPIYGFGALLITQSTKLLDDIFIGKSLTSTVIKLLLSIILTTLLEYYTGLLLEKVFKCTWWDYSDEFLNIKGRICLKYSMAWGILAYIFIEGIHPLFSLVITSMQLSLKYIFLTFIVVYFVWDISKSINDILKLKQILFINYKKPIEEFYHKLVKYRRIYSAFPRLYFPRIGKVNGEVRRFLNDKLQRLKFKLRIGTSDIEKYKRCIEDLIIDDSVQLMNQFNHHCSVTCFEHSIHVSIYSYLICKSLGLDYRSAARGGLLHDLFLYDWKTTKLDSGKHGFVHPKIALNNADKYFKLNDIEKDTIIKHMFPLTIHPPIYKESIVVCLVDKICATLEIMGIYSDFGIHNEFGSLKEM